MPDKNTVIRENTSSSLLVESIKEEQSFKSNRSGNSLIAFAVTFDGDGVKFRFGHNGDLSMKIDTKKIFLKYFIFSDNYGSELLV